MNKPNGWILQKMENDLKGFVGNLDLIVPELFKDDIYYKDRLGLKYTSKILGVAEEEVEGSLQLQWWNSETKSNYYDGFIRHVILLNSKQFEEKLFNYIENIFKTQDESGYMGIYTKEKRFNFDSESGELWAQTTLFRGLIYYAKHKNYKLFEQIIKAVDVTIEGFNIKTRPFQFEQTHGLMFIDVLDELYKNTNDSKYQKYAIFLYENFSKEKVEEFDLKFENLEKEDLYACHGVHTYEHIRALAIIASYDEKYLKYLNKALEKLENHLLPSGAPIGDEWISYRVSDCDHTGYEYCSIHELLHTYEVIYEKFKNQKYLEKMENLFFNAALGAMHPEKSCIAYLKNDNSYSMNGDVHFKQPNSPHKTQTRYKYSPAHQDAAVCCVPNAGRIIPYYLEYMFEVKENNIFKLLYGPCIFKEKINNVDVLIKEDSNFSKDSKISYLVKVSEKIELNLFFRIPEWSDDFEVLGVDYERHGNFIKINQIFNNEIKFDILFHKKIAMFLFNDDVYFKDGPLLLALHIKHKEYAGKKYLENFEDLYYEPLESVENYKYVSHYIEDNKLHLKVCDNNDYKDVVLDYFNNSILRKVVFKVKK